MPACGAQKAATEQAHSWISIGSPSVKAKSVRKAGRGHGAAGFGGRSNYSPGRRQAGRQPIYLGLGTAKAAPRLGCDTHCEPRLR